MLAAPCRRAARRRAADGRNLLRDAGYDVVMLGSDVPAEALAAADHRHRPDVICLSSTMPGGGRGAGRDRRGAAAWPAVGFVIGGRGLTSRVRSRPGIDVCRRVSDAVEAVDAMVKRGGRN